MDASTSPVRRAGVVAILRKALLQLDQAARSGPNPLTDRRVRRPPTSPSTAEGYQAVLKGLGIDGNAITPWRWMGREPEATPDIARARAAGDAGYRGAFDIRFTPDGRSSAGIKRQRRHRGGQAKAGFACSRSHRRQPAWWRASRTQGRPDVHWAWGYTRRRRRILHDVLSAGAVQLLLQQSGH